VSAQAQQMKLGFQAVQTPASPKERQSQLILRLDNTAQNNACLLHRFCVTLLTSWRFNSITFASAKHLMVKQQWLN
jgi:hypothetical protein